MSGPGNNDMTSIGIRKFTRERLAGMKVHPNQSFDELINKLLDEKEGRD